MWLVDDLAAVISDLKETSAALLRCLTRFQARREEADLTAAALHSARLFQDIGRMNAVLADMRLLLDGAKPKSAGTDIERIQAELAELRAAVAQLLEERENSHD